VESGVDWVSVHWSGIKYWHTI